jgi:molecular chaperone DnaK (HSP70)
LPNSSKQVTDYDAGRIFLRHLIRSIPYQSTEIDQLVLTTPVVSFENYLVWLNETLGAKAEQIHVVDESTAAALGYAVTEPGAVVLVFDFGGGTLDISLLFVAINLLSEAGDELLADGLRSEEATLREMSLRLQQDLTEGNIVR